MNHGTSERKLTGLPQITLSARHVCDLGRQVLKYGSGDDDPTDGDNNTVSTLYPLGHAYWGIIDNLNGQNLLDYSLQGSL
jgi:hypothetical protein